MMLYDVNQAVNLLNETKRGREVLHGLLAVLKAAGPDFDPMFHVLHDATLEILHAPSAGLSDKTIVLIEQALGVH